MNFKTPSKENQADRRMEAARLNPLIGCNHKDTAALCAQLSDSIGAWLERVEDMSDVRSVHLITTAISIALRFEASA